MKAREVLPETAAAIPVKQPPQPAEEQPERAEEPRSRRRAARAHRTGPRFEGRRAHPRGRKRIAFEIRKNHSRELAPGISIGVTGTDAASHRVDGWMWVMPDRRTIWLRDHSAHEPVIFYGHEDGKMRELVITSVAGNSVRGYLLSPESGRK